MTLINETLSIEPADPGTGRVGSCDNRAHAHQLTKASIGLEEAQEATRVSLAHLDTSGAQIVGKLSTEGPNTVSLTGIQSFSEPLDELSRDHDYSGFGYMRPIMSRSALDRALFHPTSNPPIVSSAGMG